MPSVLLRLTSTTTFGRGADSSRVMIEVSPEKSMNDSSTNIRSDG
jgi:hypothetical protein